MSTMTAGLSRTPAWKSVALPVEHGGWSLLIEPLVLGLVVAPSIAGGWLATSAVAAFLARHPLKLVALDRRRGAHYPRTELAQRFLATYATVATCSFSFALALGGPGILMPLAVAAPIAAFALWRDLQGRNREALSEMAGAVGLSASATAIVVAGGDERATAWLAWALLAARAVTAILYVRARVRVDRGLTFAERASIARPVLATHAIVLLGAFLAARAGALSPLAAGAFLLLMLRALHGLAPGRAPIRAQVLGIQEVVIGLACLGLFAAGLV